MASQANRKKPIISKAYSMDLRERLVRAVEGGRQYAKPLHTLCVPCGKPLGIVHAFTANERQNFFKAAGYSVN
jgi:hypothetical protein